MPSVYRQTIPIVYDIRTHTRQRYLSHIFTYRFIHISRKRVPFYRRPRSIFLLYISFSALFSTLSSRLLKTVSSVLWPSNENSSRDERSSRPILVFLDQANSTSSQENYRALQLFLLVATSSNSPRFPGAKLRLIRA